MESLVRGRRSLFALLCLCFFIAAPAFPERQSPLRSPYDRVVARAYRSCDSHVFGLPRGTGLNGQRILGGIVPHHDVAMGMIMRFYEELNAGDRICPVQRVFLFAPDHFRQVRRWAAVCPANWMFFGDPTRVLSADADAITTLGDADIVEMRSEIFEKEHGITLHIPFIALFFPNATVVPILLRPDIPDIALLSLRKRLAAIMREGDVVILSMDLSHYKPLEALRAEDDRTIAALTEMRHAATHRLDVDAPRAAKLALLLFKDGGATRGTLLKRSDTSAILGEHIESGTGYATILYGVDE